MITFPVSCKCASPEYLSATPVKPIVTLQQDREARSIVLDLPTGNAYPVLKYSNIIESVNPIEDKDIVQEASNQYYSKENDRQAAYKKFNV